MADVTPNEQTTTVEQPAQPQAPMTTEAMLDRIMGLNTEPSADVDAEADPMLELQRGFRKMEAREFFRQKWDEFQVAYPEMSRTEFNEIQILETQGNFAEAESIRKKAEKRERETKQSQQEQELKDKHTEGTGTGTPAVQGRPKTQREAVRRMASRL